MNRHSLPIWLLLALLVLIDGVWLALEGMSLAQGAITLILMFVAGIGALGWFYTMIRPNPRIAALAFTASATLALMSATCILSYLAVTINRPLVDPYLAAADRAIGIDWLAMHGWIRERRWLHTAMVFIYMALIPQIFILQIVFTFRAQMAWAWELVWLVALTCIGCVFFSGIWPAAGSFAYFHVEPQTPYLHEFAALRAGTLKVIDSTGEGMQGLVTFPSLHMALAVLLPYAARGLPILFPLFLVLNVMIMATTPFIGGHHFADLWGGAILALASIWIVRGNFSQKLLVEPKAVKAKKSKRKR